MTVHLSQRDRRAGFTGIATIAAIILASRGFPAWAAWSRDTRLAASETAAELARAEAVVGQRRAVRDSLEARGRRYVALAPLLLGGDTRPAAEGVLAGLVSGAAAAANVRVTSVDVRADSASSAAFARVSARATATGDITGIARMLEILERGPTLLSIRELSINQAEPAAPATRAEVLRVEVRVEGLALNRTTAKAQ